MLGVVKSGNNADQHFFCHEMECVLFYQYLKIFSGSGKASLRSHKHHNFVLNTTVGSKTAVIASGFILRLSVYDCHCSIFQLLCHLQNSRHKIRQALFLLLKCIFHLRSLISLSAQ